MNLNLKLASANFLSLITGLNIYCIPPIACLICLTADVVCLFCLFGGEEKMLRKFACQKKMPRKCWHQELIYIYTYIYICRLLWTFTSYFNLAPKVGILELNIVSSKLRIQFYFSVLWVVLIASCGIYKDGVINIYETSCRSGFSWSD